ncbi:MAG TPA: hypothetical protein VMT88_05485 [Actinomycetes bacterium]|nr:hypothetical protein [Actinomycetes bacterium]
MSVCSSVSRRAVLLSPALAAGSIVTAAALAGCTDEAPPVAIDPDRVALTAALVREQQLLNNAQAVARTERQSAIAAAGMQQIEAVLTTHVETLTATLGGSTPSPSTTLTTPELTPQELTAQELARASDRVAQEHTRALRTVGDEPARLLASLAASDAALASFLRFAQRSA